MSAKSKFWLDIPIPPLWKPLPFWARFSDSTCQELMRQGKTASSALSGMLAESGAGCCFVSGETGDGETGTQKPNETENDPLNRMSIPHKPSPPFASQMPPPPRGEANSASPSCRHSDGFAVGARTHEGELRGCASPLLGGLPPFREKGVSPFSLPQFRAAESAGFIFREKEMRKNHRSGVVIPTSKEMRKKHHSGVASNLTISRK